MPFVERAEKVFIVTIVFAFFTLFAVAMRLVAKFYFLKSGRKEEIVMVVCLCIAFAEIGIVYGQATHGLGHHTKTLQKEEFETLLKIFWSSIMLYGVGITLAKVSIVLGYLRIFTAGRPKVASQIAMAAVVIFGLQYIITTAFSCVPLNSFWDSDVPGKCIPKVPLFLTQACVNIVLDIFLLAIPMPVLWGLYMPIKQKLLLMVIFALGGFAVLISILRLWTLVTLAGTNDVPYDNPGSLMWSNLEVDVAIICAALQSSRPVMVHLFPRLFPTYTASRPTKGQHYELTNHGTHETHGTENRSTIPASGLFSKISTGAATPYRSSNGGSHGANVDLGRGQESELGSILVTHEMERHVEKKGGMKDFVSMV